MSRGRAEGRGGQIGIHLSLSPISPISSSIRLVILLVIRARGPAGGSGSLTTIDSSGMWWWLRLTRLTGSECFALGSAHFFQRSRVEGRRAQVRGGGKGRGMCRACDVMRVMGNAPKSVLSPPQLRRIVIVHDAYTIINDCENKKVALCHVVVRYHLRKGMDRYRFRPS